MAYKIFAALSLLLLTAAASAPGDCLPGGDGGPTLPLPLDLAGRPSLSPGLSGQPMAVLPHPQGTNGCLSPLPSTAQAPTLRGESSDMLHGLPAPDLLRPIDEQRQAPQFQ